MNDKFENQKESLLAIKHEIKLLYQQVNYLLRNEKPLELLDLDVLMNRTHTLYDQLCSINVSDQSLDEDLPFDAEDLSGLFGDLMQVEPQKEEPEEEIAQVTEEPTVQEKTMEPIEIPEEKEHEQIPVEEIVPLKEVASDVVETPVLETIEESAHERVEEADTIVNDSFEENPKHEDESVSDEYGLFFRFEDIPVTETQPAEAQIAVENEGKVVHVMEEIPEEEIPERDRVHGDDLVQDNPFEMPQMENENVDDERFEYEKSATEGLSNIFENDDAEFELSMGETLGEKMMGDDHSLAAKLQQAPGRDLKSVIGINDKFLFVNELFGGSMEKYNKSIENLNDLKTLNGAMIYLNELKIELQWNSSNEAYLKLKELVSRKFED